MSANKLTQKSRGASAALARQKALAEALFLSIGEGAIATDEAGSISNVNRAALDLLGFTKKDLLGKWYPATIILADETGRIIPTIERPITKSFISGKAATGQYYIQRKNGSFMPAVLTVSPVLLDGKPVGSIGLFRDITEELELDRLKSEFIFLASHQLRTPATAVKTYVAMLMDGYAGDLNDLQTEFAELAYLSNERQLQIINDLLVIANTESRTLVLKKHNVDLRDLINEVVEQQRDTMKKRRQELHLLLPASSVIHSVDPSFFKMIIDNLLSNASKYTPDDGRLALRLSKRKDQVEIKVSDTGVGIDPEDFPKLFKKFTRIENPLSAEVGGSGIGLYLLKQLVELHSGEVNVDSVKGEGTTFTVTLPI